MNTFPGDTTAKASGVSGCGAETCQRCSERSPRLSDTFSYANHDDGTCQSFSRRAADPYSSAREMAMELDQKYWAIIKETDLLLHDIRVFLTHSKPVEQLPVMRPPRPQPSLVHDLQQESTTSAEDCFNSEDQNTPDSYISWDFLVEQRSLEKSQESVNYWDKVRSDERASVQAKFKEQRTWERQ